MISEADLIAGIKMGEEKAFEYAFKTYYPVLSVFAKKYVYDLEVAKELVQDLFVKLFENHSKLEINSSLKSYLFQSVKNKSFTYLTQVKTRSKHLEQVAVLSKDEYYEVDYLEQTEMEERIYNAIGTLPDQCKRIFKMNRLDGKKNKEIAEELNISIRTVETQISKALKILREILTNIILAISVLFLF